MIRVTIAALLALAVTALAQPAITIEVENPVLMPGESTVVTMYAGYGSADYAVAVVATSLITSVGSEGWSDAVVVVPMNGPGATAGSPSATGFDGIVARQLNFPAPGAGIFADPTNPIAFWQATYTAPLDVVDEYDVQLATATTQYEVYAERDSPHSASRLAELTEGAATIRVIPAPASALVLVGGVLAQRRRR